MTEVSLPLSYAIRAVQPDLPEPAEYLPWLEQMHERGYYTNFGPLHDEMVQGMLAEFGGKGEGCVACCNATAGLSAALIAADVTGCVLMPAFTFPATMSAIRAAGLEPILMDVSPETWLPSVDELAEALVTTGARAVILVAPFGIRHDFAAHIAACRALNVTTIIDCAAGMGVPRLNFCDGPDVFEVFSLHATKPFGIGEGGLVYCHDSMTGAVRSALNFALSSHARPEGPHWGFNGKLSEIQAAIALAQLRRYGDIITQRQVFAAAYFVMLEQFPEIKTPPRDSVAPWQIFPALLPSETLADTAVDVAAAQGVELRRYYRPSLSQWTGVKTATPCPVSEDLAARMIALPVRSAATVANAQPVVGQIAAILRETLLSERAK